MPRRGWWALAVAAAALFAVALGRYATKALVQGGGYPPYSSFRADPLGAKALHDTLARLPGVKVERQTRPLRLLRAGAGDAIWWLGEDPWMARFWDKAQLEAFERQMERGVRVIAGFLPATGARPLMRTMPKPGSMEERWKVVVKFEESAEKAPAQDAVPRETKAYLEFTNGDWRCLWNDEGRCRAAERPWKQGTLVMVTDTFPLSNEGMREDRDAEYIRDLAGGARRFVFDEEHLGLEDASSVGLLLRQFRQQGAALALALLFGLFVWRSASSLLPARAAAEPVVAVDGGHQSLVLLLRRGVKPAGLRAACADEWRRSLALLPFKQRARAKRVEEIFAAPTMSAADAWREARRRVQGEA